MRSFLCGLVLIISVASAATSSNTLFVPRIPTVPLLSLSSFDRETFVIFYGILRFKNVWLLYHSFNRNR
jgi:hypothetical protein